ncbi:hypothetical protein RMR16_004805 [Agrobacterium sp. rho-13.3]|jgi:antitoxin ParD1/3/4|uniref:hypothetical protein n=1 Tax=Agrobacterium sp. rho-13.3 TaxID=3072980 RepID=UPI002A0B597E|nr:hypothetical protein [Agrobacterium sp. rho-13.3]MDX8311759.1 hypothetical protein [Agrobacterium sp. rho-13.3]
MAEPRESLEVAKRRALQEAVQLGFLDLKEGRFVDVTDDELESLLSVLGSADQALMHKGKFPDVEGHSE